MRERLNRHLAAIGSRVMELGAEQQRAVSSRAGRDGAVPKALGAAWLSRILPLTIVILVAVILSGLLVRDDFAGPESNLYAAYAMSVIEDGDLNIADHGRHVASQLSSTFNYPDFHNHGGVVIWVPALLLQRLIGFVSGSNVSPVAAGRFNLSLTTIGCALIILWLTFRLATRVASRRVAAFATALIALGSPFVYYSLLEPGHANLPAALGTTLLLYHLWTADPRRAFTWLVTGLLAGLCVVVKIDAWFVLGFAILASGFLIWVHRPPVAHLALGVAGLALLISAKLVNDHLRLGLFQATELTVVDVGGFYLYEQLFSPYRGYFIYSPILLVALVIGLWIAFSAFWRRSDSGGRFAPDLATNFPSATPLLPVALLCLVGVIALKLFATSFRFNWCGGTFGGRLLISELAPFVLLFAYGFQRLRSIRARWVVGGLALVALLWNWVKIVEFMEDREPAAAQTLWGAVVSFGQLVRLPADWLSANGSMSAADRLGLMIPVVLVATALTFIVAVFLRPPQRLLLGAGLAALLYLVITLLNVLNNSTLARQVVDRAAAGGNLLILAPNEYTLEENMVSLDEARAYFKLVGDRVQACKVARIRQQLWSSASQAYREHNKGLAPSEDLGESCREQTWLYELPQGRHSAAFIRRQCGRHLSSLEEIPHRLSVSFGDQIELIGYDLPPAAGHGSFFPVTLFFRTLEQPSLDHHVFVHFDAEATRLHANHAPLGGVCGTSWWQPGDIFADTFKVEAGDLGSPRGRYSVWVGLYSGSTGQWTNVNVSRGDHDGEQRVSIGEIDVY